MAYSGFFHGIETEEFRVGPTPILVVLSSVIGLVGTAPIGAVNEPKLLLGDKDHAQFGPEMDGFTIPQALKALRDFGVGTVIAINVLDPDVHKDSIEDEEVTFDPSTGLATLEKGAIANLVLTNGDETTYVLNTDYEIVSAVNGTIRALSTGAIDGSAVASYDHADPTEVVAADVIGETDEAGMRTGLQALKNAYSMFGFKAKIIHCPVYNTQNSVRAAMDVIAQSQKAIALVDAPIGTTPQQAITGRGPSGAINFNTSSGRAKLLYPHLKVADSLTGGERLEPYSNRMAALICWNDVNNGYWASPSNKELPGVLGLERPIVGDYTDPQSEANALNAAGITTVMNSYGTGIRSWGNRLANFPSDPHPFSFLCVRRTADMIEESIDRAEIRYSDMVGSAAMITSVIEDVSTFLRTLVQRGAIIDGKIWFDPAENSSDQLAAGHYTWCYDFMPPTPAERITNKAYMNTNYLDKLAQQLASAT